LVEIINYNTVMRWYSKF